MEKYAIATQNNATYLEYEVKDEELLDEVDRGMLVSNQIQGLLPLNVRWLDNKCKLMYKITGLTSLNCAERILSNEAALTNFIRSLAKIERECDEYLLNLCKLELEPENVYVSITGAAMLLYLPLQGERKPYQIAPLLKYVLGLVGQKLPEDSRLLSKLLMKLMYNEDISLAELEQSLREEPQKQPKAAESSEPPQYNYAQPYYEAERSPQYVAASPEPQAEAQQISAPQQPEKSKRQKRPWFKNKNEKKAEQPVQGGDNPFVSEQSASKSDEQDHLLEKKPQKHGLLGGFGKKNKGKKEQNVDPVSDPVAQQPAASAQPAYRYNVAEQKQSYSGARTVILGNKDTNDASATKLMTNNSEAPKLFLVQKSTGQCIHITHDNFHIGRAQGVVDFTVPNASEYLGNDHAYISIVNGCYYIVDNNTLNHTYLNESKLAPSKPTQIRAGDTVRMADIVFTVVEGS